LRGRIRALPRRLGRRGLAGVAASLALFLATGGFVFYHTNLLTRYETGEEIQDRRAEYERTYRRYETLPRPTVAAVRTRVELYPSERRFQVAGAYRLENRARQPVDTVMVSLRWQLKPERMELAGARLLRYDERFGTWLFALARPLAPGAATELRFRVRSAPETVVAGGFSYSVVGNGSYVTRQAAFPRLGYVVGYELENAYARRLHGLPPPREGMGVMSDPDRADAREGWLTVDATISTDADQTALGPGDLVREWRQGGRRFFQYRTAQPQTPVFGFVSGRYQVRRVNHHGVWLEVYHDPAHPQNAAKMLAVAGSSLDLFGRLFGPYPHRSLRIVEIPGHWEFGAYALTGMIVWPEDRGFLTDERYPGEVDLITRRVAHEVSHQWWGHQLYPAQAAGSTALVETLAKYSEMRVLEARHGPASLVPLLRYERELYLLSRANLPFPEPSLTRVVDLEHVYYSKGAIVFEALRDLIGEDAVNRALRRLLREHGAGGRPATAADLVEALQAEAAPEHHALIAEWLDEVTFYDFRVESATAQRLADGRYRVTATVRAAKKLLVGGRVEAAREAPLDEMIDVAVFAEPPLSTGGAPLYAGKQRLRGGENRITFEMSGRPRFISLDAFERRIEEERADNVREVALRP
ncbi:MAG TPA: M1 family aminopeptidase, partial [Longimicrobiaceae bacterium]|nr:M1 family aminopeptidase [Longimicrobiaceae bacterium]